MWLRVRWLKLMEVFFLGSLSPVLPLQAEPTESLWTETILSTEGSFSVRIDPESRSVVAMRSDDRAGPSPQLRVKITLPKGGEWDIELRAQERGGRPLWYLGQDPAWNGELTGFRVEYSYDAKAWKALTPRKRP
jgi:hypothetical protein